ncbi:hypothetical protein D028_0568 [Vibrio parahaemolyticus 50]|nr:hypothetical protein D028_0568 [Vibrio parahaemolyticus 50]
MFVRRKKCSAKFQVNTTKSGYVDEAGLSSGCKSGGQKRRENRA